MANTHVMQSRPSDEAQVQSYLGQESSYQAIYKQFEGWQTSLKNLSAKPRISLSISKPLMEALLQSFSNISKTLDHAPSQGMDWVCSNRSLAINIALSNLLVREITSDQAREANALVDAATQRIEADLASL